jgi:hypothetical protein
MVKVGDLVRMNAYAERYTITKPGSIGRVTRILGEKSVAIDYMLLTGNNRYDDTEFPIAIRTFDVITIDDFTDDECIIFAKQALTAAFKGA